MQNIAENRPGQAVGDQAAEHALRSLEAGLRHADGARAQGDENSRDHRPEQRSRRQADKLEQCRQRR